MAIDILRQLFITGRRNRFLLEKSDWFYKLVKNVSLINTLAWKVARALVDSWVHLHKTPKWLLSDKESKFKSNFFQPKHRTTGVASLFMMSYHPQWKGQMERLNQSIVEAIPHYVANIPRWYDLKVGTLTHAYNTEIHCTPKCAPFELTLSMPPHPRAVRRTAQDNQAILATKSLHRWQQSFEQLMPEAGKRTTEAKQKYTENFD